VIEVYLVYPVKKATGVDPVNQACQVIPVYPVFQVHEVQKVYPAVMDVTEHEVKTVDPDLMDNLAAQVNQVSQVNEVQKVNLHKLYPDSKAKSDHKVLPVFPALLDHPAMAVCPDFQVQLASPDVKVPKVTVVTQVSQVHPVLVLVALKVKKESLDHLLPLHHHLNKKLKATTVIYQSQFLVPLVQRVLWVVKVNLVKSVIPAHLVLPVHPV